MDMKVCVLGSSSDGNATLLWTRSTKILIDAGFSGKEMERRLRNIGIDPCDLKGIVLSHEHSDHTRGAGVLSRRYEIPVYANHTTFQKLRYIGEVWERRHFDSHKDFKIKEFNITPLVVPHDASEPNAFVIRCNGKKVTIATDMGVYTETFIEQAQNSNLIIIESNYDKNMLLSGFYPPPLKERILSDFGHLSNSAAAKTLRQVIGTSTRHVLLAHISQNNNTPDLAKEAANKHLKDFEGVSVGLTHPFKCSEIIKI
ncbi:MAG: MBL fold metallo-hydrolase [Methanomassiliicoccales archaeon]|nr:MAG: MBL fold metallo-hydrolase [Methanomassiliicoccales archaeon]